MKLPNWQHHSKKEQKRTLKPQALRLQRASVTAVTVKHINLKEGMPQKINAIAMNIEKNIFLVHLSLLDTSHHTGSE
jgi:hypothetical protein